VSASAFDTLPVICRGKLQCFGGKNRSMTSEPVITVASLPTPEMRSAVRQIGRHSVCRNFYAHRESSANGDK
jgi:hypothetical protein